MVSSQNLSQLLGMLVASTMFLKCVDSAPSGLLGLTDTQRRNIFITGHIPRIRVERNSSGNDKPKTMVIKAMALPKPVTLPIYEDADELLLAERVASYGLNFDPDATAEAEGVENNVVDVNNSDVTAKGRLMRPMAPPSAQGPLIGPPPSRVEILLPQAQGRFPGDLETLLKLIESIEATASTESNEIKETDAGVTLVPMALETESTEENSTLVDTTPAAPLMEPEMLGEQDSQASMMLMAENSPLPATAKPPSSVALNVNTEPSSTTPEATTTTKTTTRTGTTTPSQPIPALTSSSTTEIPPVDEGNQPSSTSSTTTLVFTQPSRTSPTIGTTPTTTATPKPTTATAQQLGTMTTPFTTKLHSPATTTRPAPAVSPAAEMVSSTPSNKVLTTVMMKTTTTMTTPPPSSTMTSTTRTTSPTSLPPTTSKTSTTARSTPSSTTPATSSSPLPSTTTTTTTVKTPTTTTTTKAPLTLATAMTTTTTSPPSPLPFVTTDKYSYGYSIADQDTGDFKSAKEIRNGDTVRGEYRVLEPDGITLRIVRYSVEPGSGFRAEIEFQKINFTTSSTPPPPPPTTTTTTTRKTTPTETPSTTTPAPPIFILLPLVEPINVADMVSVADLPFMVAEPDGVVVIDQPASGPQHQQPPPGQEEPILVPAIETEPPSFSSSRVNDGSAAASQLPKMQPNVDQASQQQDIPVKSDANSEVQPATANTANDPVPTAIDNPSSDPFVNIPAFDIPSASIPSAQNRRNARRNVIMDRMVSHRLRQVRTERATTPQQHTISDVSKPALLDRRRVSMKRKPSSSTNISIANEPRPAIHRIPAARTRRRRQ